MEEVDDVVPALLPEIAIVMPVEPKGIFGINLLRRQIKIGHPCDFRMAFDLGRNQEVGQIDRFSEGRSERNIL